jgi:hypothetical protein
LRQPSKSRSFICGRSLVALAAISLILPATTGCWVQSVYPFYEDSDVAVDSSLIGDWAGEAELKSCLLNIKLDAATRTYTFEVSKSTDKNVDSQCEAASFAATLIRINQQRFFDVVPNQEKSWAAPLDMLLKVDEDGPKLNLVPLDPDWLENAINDKTVNLHGRVQEFGLLPRFVAVTLVSPTGDLREFLRQHGNDKRAFSRSSGMIFLRQ